MVDRIPFTNSEKQARYRYNLSTRLDRIEIKIDTLLQLLSGVLKDDELVTTYDVESGRFADVVAKVVYSDVQL